jgi:hypothetical protein
VYITLKKKEQVLMPIGRLLLLSCRKQALIVSEFWSCDVHTSYDCRGNFEVSCGIEVLCNTTFDYTQNIMKRVFEEPNSLKNLWYSNCATYLSICKDNTGYRNL